MKIYNVKTLTFYQVLGPSRVEFEKKAFGSGLYIPWRGTYRVALMFFFVGKNAFLKHYTV